MGYFEQTKILLALWYTNYQLIFFTIFLFQIEKFKQEAENASKTIERLQIQLQQQSDYNLLKREIQ